MVEVGPNLKSLGVWLLSEESQPIKIQIIAVITQIIDQAGFNEKRLYILLEDDWTHGLPLRLEGKYFRHL